MGARPGGSAFAVVVRQESYEVALLCDAVADVARIQRQHAEALLPTVQASQAAYFRVMHRLPVGLTAEIDLHALFNQADLRAFREAGDAS